MPRYGARDQEQIRMAGRGDESKTQSFQHVIGVGEGVDLELAAIAGAGVHVPDGEAMAKTLERRGLESLGLGAKTGVGGWRHFRDDAHTQRVSEDPIHCFRCWGLQIVSAVMR